MHFPELELTREEVCTLREALRLALNVARLQVEKRRADPYCGPGTLKAWEEEVSRYEYLIVTFSGE